MPITWEKTHSNSKQLHHDSDINENGTDFQINQNLLFYNWIFSTQSWHIDMFITCLFMIHNLKCTLYHYIEYHVIEYFLYR